MSACKTPKSWPGFIITSKAASVRGLSVHYLADIRLIKPIGALAFARHPGAAFAALVAIPLLVWMVLAYPTETGADGAVRIYHLCFSIGTRGPCSKISGIPHAYGNL
jgi:hypothetical protein